MIDWALALTSTSKAIETAKLLLEVGKAYDEATFKLTIANLTGDLANVKLALTDARAESREKDEEIAALRKTFAFRQDHTTVVRGFRYEMTNDGKPQGMPFCQRCDAVDGRLIPLAKTRSKDGFRAICPQCKSDFGGQHGFGYVGNGDAVTTGLVASEPAGS
jgi:hypothetical protein